MNVCYSETTMYTIVWTYYCVNFIKVGIGLKCDCSYYDFNEITKMGLIVVLYQIDYQ